MKATDLEFRMPYIMITEDFARKTPDEQLVKLHLRAAEKVLREQITAYRIAQDVPEHDVLVAGFPCQPFSLAGVSKKKSLGRAHGFACETQGTLFFDIARILDAKRPSAFLLENVKNLAGHDKGRTLEVILKTLHDELGYHVDYNVIDARHFVPQHRERVFIVGFKEPTNFAWDQVVMPDGDDPLLGSILHSENGNETAEPDFSRPEGVGKQQIHTEQKALEISA